ncbi:ADP-forming succinate--CoA ligase subunit beta [Roseivirga pacifica]|jgi:succinyl-CoA synthetase beta subunit|uniref:ADP-forming succinate--CoA ligase subunit beta n=1 Tax=Roseivirga pacifica TaxID=1267423 RepID=UPI002095A8D3|nr:ADP-forming succinate--CoA ligase subunit beta [Roseivirga pacifica]MCO6357430.1 ADP-forming succinate--CoA ligase subunit beta [Roseivirga pacifica]MCO6367806.1 ADP-forming succinate--CoA ligase subunit beta [Roseivirga pacifica]MCO6369663.1 ADP-forming succinate--CoA ligase subunit beta [Roseivirga pacifica]MCO6373517.1 ADP-forming succinate--CoA ligase subunit beta [Roseivirga pacifica]MCO6377178.1 ADP-forming succinate--CoA ligase subunit beta [Roseivirga pacifica]
MNIHEYQAKELLKKYGVKIQEGIVADTPDEATSAAKTLNEQTGTSWYVVKAQIHAGGRGKGKVQETGSNGVVLAKSLEEVAPKAEAILGGTLVTHQTGAEGKKVNKVLIAQDVYYPGDSEPKEYYLSILLDRAKGCNVIMASTEGGMDIETVAEETPEKIIKEWIDPRVGLQGFQARKVAFKLGLEGQAFKEMVKFIYSLYKAYEDSDASQFEINPVLKTSDNQILAVDAKVNLDDNGLFRHKDLVELRDITEEDPSEVEAGKYGLSYVKLDGNVGCMVNGAGLAMATMDIIKLSGGEPANFLDVGGTANAETVEAGFRIIMKDPNVKAILINIFGGIVRCDRVANGVVEAYKKIGNIDIPIIVRLQGTNAEEAAKIIDESGLAVQSAIMLKDAANRVQDALS